MDILFKYHLRLYALYEKFGTNLFYAREGFEAIQNSYYINSTFMFYSGLEKKEYLIVIPYKVAQLEVLNFNRRCTYRKITQKGINVIKEIEKNKKLLTKILLRN